jgi:microcystin-dependent protein
MSEPYIGEIRLFAGNFAPLDWAFCNGQMLAISDYTALFTLIGNTYGGDGVSTFALPNLQSRVPVHQGTLAGSSYVMGQLGGAEQVTLTPAQLPAHTHVAQCSAAADRPGPTPAGAAFWAPANAAEYAAPSAANTQMAGSALGVAGGNQPHDNLSPYQAVNYIIALYGIYPSQN